ncbi:MAG: precorrin-3B synthase [Defluviimonas denitrificans]
MSAPVIQGWCPGALRPMMSGDGLVVRVRARGGRLEPAQIRAIANLARQHGNGLIDLSARANVQLRGVSGDSHAPLIDGLMALDLVDANAENEARRNILVNPVRPHFLGDPDLYPNVPIADALADALAGPDAPRLPGKFGFVVDLHLGLRYLGRDIGDIRIESAETGGQDFILRADGMSTGTRVTGDTAAGLAIEMARWFIASGGVGPDGRGRMRDHIAGGAQLPAGLTGDVSPAPQARPPKPGPYGGGKLLAFAFGQVRAEKFAWLAKAGGSIRITPWRMVYFSSGLKRRRDLHHDGDFITNPSDPLLSVVACTGAPGCPQALGPTRALARQLAPLVPQGKLLHVSGCAKGCAHPGPAPATLTATAPGRYDLILNDTAAGTPARPGIKPDDLTTTDLFPTG